jgi:hypothetical protein
VSIKKIIKIKQLSLKMGNIEITEKSQKAIELQFEEFGNEQFLKITNHDLMKPFFISIVSDSDHWMFISSNGGLTAGRKNSEFSLFPYYTDDKITEFADITGSKTIFHVVINGKEAIWEPFLNKYYNYEKIERNIYKSILGNKIIFEEVNKELNLTFKYCWANSHKYGFIKKSTLVNHSDHECTIDILDGIQNILPYGVSPDLQVASSNLVDAYKRSELDLGSGVGIFALSAIISDKAEPSEALKANVAWSIGLDNPTYLLSSAQVDLFRKNQTIQTESDIKGEKGAYFINKKGSINAFNELSWSIVANVNQNHAQIIQLINDIKNNTNIVAKVFENIETGNQNLRKLVASSDGIIHTNDTLQDNRHYSNVLFNIMRGGIFDDNYTIEKSDFIDYLTYSNSQVVKNNDEYLSNLSDTINYTTLITNISDQQYVNLIRLAIEYLPLKFSRRHGDPSRPWNKFSINLYNDLDQKKILDYEGNWRDIFQNWEALACAYPDFIDGMIFKFVNSSTFDGYNPYRLTKSGFDWEVSDPDDPWSHIGYWGDHQIIYLQKLLEIIDAHNPNKLESYFDKEWFVYAAVPYTIKGYEEIKSNPKDTILFDVQQDKQIRESREKDGSDGALIRDQKGSLYYVNFIEKILATSLAKLSNFIPEGGIWMNTQRPEWNDANNALVGNGTSMVTLCYLRRFLIFLKQALQNNSTSEFNISEELLELFVSLNGIFSEFEYLLAEKFPDQQRQEMVDKLGVAGAEYRNKIYKNGFSGVKSAVTAGKLLSFIDTVIEFTDHSIKVNERSDGLYHAYNLITFTNDQLTISHLDEMLEGQVAVLSSGFLSPQQSLHVLDSLRSSSLYRNDQFSYILYPNKSLPSFLDKNTIPKEELNRSSLLQKLISENNKSIVEKDIQGNYHFNSSFKNKNYLKDALTKLKESEFAKLVDNEENLILEIYENVFNHKSFTGRSGTFYGYEGLGSIYWHMVSKLLLAAQESCKHAIEINSEAEIVSKLVDHYYHIKSGIGVHKSPSLYGAFPTDPYSHTPIGKGAQQPGMTGQVKEDILVNLGELGVKVMKGIISFTPEFLRINSFLQINKPILFVDINGNEQELLLKTGQLFFTFCQVPVVYTLSTQSSIEIRKNDGTLIHFEGHSLNKEISSSIFSRKNEVSAVFVQINQSSLKY